MSDAQGPAEAEDGNGAAVAPPPAGLRLDQPIPPGSNSEPAGAEGPDDQPMLDLRFPDPPSPPAELVHASEPPPPHAELIPLPPDGPAPPFAGSERPAEAIVVEVSPILSALDAADLATARYQPAYLESEQPSPGILLPRQPHFMMAPAEAPAPLMDEAPPAPVEAALADFVDPAADFRPDFQPPAEATDASPPMPEEESAAPMQAEQQEQEQDQPNAADQLHDAAAKIAEEANATAEALESLKRLLHHNLPLLDTMATPAPAESSPPSPIPAYQAPVHQPVTPPPMIPLAATPLPDMSDMPEYAPPPRARSGMPVGGFLAGFALSWVFGAVLYAYLIMG
jgi:hypothetical protein